MLGLLAVLDIHVVAPEGAALLLEGKELPLSVEGWAHVVRPPGPVELLLRRGEHVQKQSLQAGAGTLVHVEFALDASPRGSELPIFQRVPTPQALVAPHEPKSWTTTMLWISGVTAVVGAGTFVGFGLVGQGTYDRLYERCGPNRCPETERSQADFGAMSQTVANVGLVVGAVGLTGLATLLVLRALQPKGATMSVGSLHF